MHKVAAENDNLRRIFIVTATSVTSLFFAFLFLYRTHFQHPFYTFNGVKAEDASASTVNALGKSIPDAGAPLIKNKKAPRIDLHIANNGLVLLSGASVVSISDGTIHVIIAWDSAEFTWEVKTKLITDFLTPGGKKEELKDIQVGDIVTVSGQLIKGGAEPIVDARFVREL